MKSFFSLALVVSLIPFTAAQAQKTLEQQAEAMLDKALRPAPAQTKQNLATQAEELFKKAVAAAKGEEAKAKSDKDRHEAQYQVGVLLMGQSRTYIDLSKDLDLRKRADVIEEARKKFTEIVTEYEKAKGKDKDLAPLIYKCRAWLYKCGEDGGDPEAVKVNLEKVQFAKNKDAEEAQALIRYFRLIGPAKKALGPLDRARAIQKEADAWLKDYPTFKNSTMGFAVRYEQATATFAEAEFFAQKKKLLDENIAKAEKEIKEGKELKPPKTPMTVLGKGYEKYLADKKDRDLILKDAKTQADRLAKVQAMCKSIMETENDFSEKAKGLDYFISRLNVVDKLATDLSTFEQCYLRAREDMEMLGKLTAEAKEAAPDAKAGLEKNRKALFRSIAQTLNRGISLADAKTAPDELDDARFDLLISYMAVHDPYRTAVAGEAMSKTKPLTKKSAQAAGYAIQAYAEILAEDLSEGNKQRMRDMANYVLSTECQQAWAKEPVTGVARFQLAMLLFKEGERVAGIEQLKLVPKEYPAYLFCQAKLVFAALEVRDKTKKPEEKKVYQDLVRKTLGELKQLPAGTDPTSASMYFHARMEETKLLYADAADATAKKDTVQARKLYQQMSAFVTQLGKELQSAPQIGNDQRKQLTDYMATMQKYSILGQADFEYRGGAYDQVVAVTAPTVEVVRKEFEAAKKVFDETVKVEADAAKKKFDAAKKDFDAASTQPVAKKKFEEAKKEFDAAQKEAGRTFVFNLSDFQVTGDVLSFALRANVQQGKIDDAKQLLKIVETLKGGLLADSSNVMRNLVLDLEIQVRELKKSGDRDKLKKTVANFSEFLDAVIKQTEKKAVEKGDIFFLAKCFDSLDRHEKAAELYALYPAPKFLNVAPKKGEKEVKFTEDQEKELQTYWYTQVQQARQLRLSVIPHDGQKVTDAEKLRKLTEAKKILDTLEGHVNARQQIIAAKEQNHVLEDSGLYGKAVAEWSKFMNNPGLKKSLGSDTKIQAIYFDAYYHMTYCYYKFSQTDKVKQANKDALYLDKAVGYIIRLETATSKEGWQLIEHRFRELLDNERVLNDAYKKKKAAG